MISNKITLKAPMGEGRYRLFVFVDDGKKVAYLNIPIYTEQSLNQNEKITLIKKELEPYND